MNTSGDTTVNESTLVTLPAPESAPPRTQQEVLAWIEIQRRLIRLRKVQREAIDQLALPHSALTDFVTVALCDASCLHSLDVLEERILDELYGVSH